MTMGMLPIANSDHNFWVRGGDWEVRLVNYDENVIDVSGFSTKKHFLADRGEAWMPLAIVGSSFQLYDPIEKEPNLFMKFSEIGRRTWEDTENSYLCPQHLDSFSSHISEGLIKEVIAFCRDYGALFFYYGDIYFGPDGQDELFQDRLSFDFEGAQECAEESLHNFLLEAQRVDFAIQYLRVMTFDSTPPALIPNLQAIIRQEKHREVGSSGYRRGLKRGRSSTWYLDELDSLDLSTSKGVFQAAEYFLRSWVLPGLAGLTLQPSLKETKLGPSDWRTEFQYKNLLNVIWYQVHRALTQRAQYRTCNNERCPNPERLFSPERNDQQYCDKRCRDAQGARQYRKRKAGDMNRLTEDILP